MAVEQSVDHAGYEPETGDPYDYETLVARYEWYVKEGHADLEEVELPDDVPEAAPFDAEDLRADIARELGRMSGHTEPEATTNVQPDLQSGVDWAALWDEFGLGGKRPVPSAVLTLAVECSEQNIDGDSQQRIAEGVDSGVLLTEERETANVGSEEIESGTITAGYRLGREA